MNDTSTARWRTKKLARAVFALAGIPTAMLGRNQAFALTYHRIGFTRKDPFCVATRDFEQQMAVLGGEGRAISLSRLEAYVRGEASLPRNACLVTIDDGMISTLEQALPILQKYQVPAVIYVSTALVGRDLDGLPERYMTWDELRAVEADGLLTVGSHAHTHRSLGRLAPPEVLEELTRSRKMLEDELGHSVTSFAYPFGTKGDFSPATRSALQEAGYGTGFISMHGRIVPGTDLLSLPRIKVEGGESAFLFSLISRGATTQWRVVDENLWRFQRNRTELR